jgi:hypothetical protein
MTRPNSPTVPTRRKMKDFDAYDQLPPVLRAALQEGPVDMCSVQALHELRREKKRYGQNAAKIIAQSYLDWFGTVIAKAAPWSSDPKRPSSPHIRAGATMQLSGRPPVLAQPESQGTEPPRQAALL